MSADLRVLVVEDDDAIRSLFVECLSDAGFEVQEAPHGAAALEVLADWRPDAIVLDLMMPVMSGWVFREYQRKLPAAADIPVIVISASRDLAASTATMDAAAVLAKPVDMDALEQIVQRVVRSATHS